MIPNDEWEQIKECDDCFLFTAREAEQCGMRTSQVAGVKCAKHRGEHGWEAWVTSENRGWVRCVCGQEFTYDGDGPPVDEQMDAHRAAMSVPSSPRGCSEVGGHDADDHHTDGARGESGALGATDPGERLARPARPRRGAAEGHRQGSSEIGLEHPREEEPVGSASRGGACRLRVRRTSPGELLCFSCGLPLPIELSVVKDQMRVHQLCPPPGRSTNG